MRVPIYSSLALTVSLQILRAAALPRLILLLQRPCLAIIIPSARFQANSYRGVTTRDDSMLDDRNKILDISVEEVMTDLKKKKIKKTLS